VTDDEQYAAEHAAAVAAAPPQCKCSHPASNHATRTGICWSVVCGCATYRPKEASK
jgi:hypothetical protein